MKKQPKIKMQRFTFKDFETMFPDDATCLDWLRDYLYPDGMFCKICEEIRPHHRVASRPSYSCDYCGHHVHPTAGTIFHKSSTSLKTWFHAIYLMASTRCGISAKQIERETGVTYKTAWRMFKQIRTMLTDDGGGPLSGKVEMDETYMGGVRKYGTGRPMVGDRKKTPVAAIVERQGRVVAKAIPTVSGAYLLPMIREHVAPNTIIHTDEWRGYEGIKQIQTKDHEPANYRHRTINHSSRVYVRGDVHTNTVEGFWSLLKRGIGGVYHSVSQKHLQSYLDEYSFRYNHRKDIQPMFVSFLEQIAKQ